MARPRVAARVAAAFAALAAARMAAAQPGALSVAVRDTAARVVEPGSAATVAYVVTNVRTAPAAADVSVELPPRWRAVTGEGRLELEGSATDLRLVGLAVPADAPAGRYDVTLVIAPLHAAAPSARATASVRVRARRRLALAGGEAPEMVAAGERFEATFVATNVGNAPVTVRALARGGDGLRVSTDSAPYLVAPGASRTVRVNGRADPAHAHAAGTRLVRLVLEPEGPPADAPPSVSAAVSVTVLPPAAVASDLFARMPTTVTLRGGHDGTPGRDAVRGFEWAGAGAVGTGVETRVDFLARWSTTGVSPVGDRDLYRLDVRRPGVELRLGDQVHALSPLTEAGRYARGIGARLGGGALSAGGFAYRGGRRGAGEQAAGAYARARHSGSELGVQYLDVGAGGAGRAVTARARLAGDEASGGRAHADAEYGAALGAPGARAWRVSAAVDTRVLGFDLRLTEADSAYPGAAGGIAERSGWVTLRPWRALRIGGQYDARRTAPTRYAGALPGRSAVAALRVDVGELLWARYRTAESEWRAGGASFAAGERAAEVRLSTALGPARLAAQAEAGAYAQRGGAQETPFRSGRVEASLALPWGTALGGWAAAAEGRSLRNRFGSWARSLGAAADVGRGRATTARVAASIHETGVAWPGRTARLELEAARRLPRGHELALHLRVPARGDAVAEVARPTAQLDYRIPLAAPVGMRRDVGRLGVRVTDARTGRGVPGVLLRVGAASLVTDEAGVTAVVALPAGAHVLRIERTGAESGLVPEAPLPPATVQAGRTVRLHIALARPARLAGQVRRYVAVGSRLTTGDARTLVEADGVAGLAVTLTRGAEIVRRVTDADGGFSLDELRPGRWHVQVAGTIPADHTLEHATLQADLGPGERRELTWRVVPRERRVQMTTEAEILAEPAPPRAGVPPRPPVP